MPLLLFVVAAVLGCTLFALAVVYYHWVRHRAQSPKEAATAEARLSNVCEMQPAQVHVDDEAAEADLAGGTCRLCGFACSSTCGRACGGAAAMTRIRASPVRGDIVVTAQDVCVRSANPAADSFFFGPAGGDGCGDGGGGCGGGAGGACVAALPGRDYGVWHCRPELHPPGRFPAGQTCSLCRPIANFRLQPDELLFHGQQRAADNEEGGSSSVGDVWIVAFVEDSAGPTAPPGAGVCRLAYRGTLAALKRLPCGGAGKLTVQFGANFDAEGADADASEGDETADRDLGGQLRGSRTMLSQLSDSDVPQLEFNAALLAGQVCSSNEYTPGGGADPSEYSDCGATSSSTVSAATEQSPVPYIRNRQQSVKWAAIGMQEVANIIESSSSEDLQLPDLSDGGEAELVAALQSQNSACDAGEAAEAAAAAAADAVAAAETAATTSDAEYLRFMYSEDASSSADVDSDGRARAGDVGGGDGRGGLTMSADFYSADSNVTSLAGSMDGGLSDLDK